MSTFAVSFRSVSRHFGDVRAVDSVTLDIHAGEFFAMLGPSGSGKTTCLRLIAGFEQATKGHVEIFGKRADGIPPYKRNVNTVFQDYALFPHLNVLDNVSYGLMVRGVDKTTRYRVAHEMLELVKLPGYGDRRPGQLSGGQRQRVALARALVNQPQVLLLDEPLGALDLKLREAMQDELRTLQKSLGITFIFVTHDQGEALSMADRIAIFNAGKIVQTGTPFEIYERPNSRFIADFVGSANILPPVFMQTHYGINRWASLRPETIEVYADPLAGSLTGELISTHYLGAATRLVIDIEGMRLSALLPKQREREAVAQGATVSLSWPKDALHLMDDEE